MAYITVAILTATTFVFGGFMREQVCIYMCPWPRIQAAMMDEQTLTVAYREWRGEPRGKGTRRRAAAERAEAEVRAAGPKTGGTSPLMLLPGTPTGVPDGSPATRIDEPEPYGDCIDCNACVNVCPTGVDIREGQQLGCITCALCIDACNEVMAKIGKPPNLIGYLTLADGERELAGEPPIPVWRRILRPRVLLYTVLWAGFGLALVAALVLRTDMSIGVDPVRNPVYVTLADGSVRNAYEVRLRNMTGFDRDFTLSVETPDPLALDIQGAAGASVTVPANTTLKQRVYLTGAPESAASRDPLLRIAIVAADAGSGHTAREETVFHGREP